MGIRLLRSTSATEVEFVKRWLLAGAVAALALGGAVVASAQVSPNGDEFQVNTYTTSYQEGVAIASDSAGNFVVVWHSDGSDDADTDDNSILAQRYDAKGTPLGGEFLINSYTTSTQHRPAVASDAAGDFVVVWGSYGSDGDDNGSDSIQAQRFDAGGILVGGQFQVNSDTTGDQNRPAVASDAAGNFVVAWQSYGSGVGDTSSYSVHAQRYDASGVAQGPEFLVNSYTTNPQYAPAVASDASGNFVVVWLSYGSSATDTSGFSVQAQRYDATGTPLGGEFQVNTYTTNHQRQPKVSSAPAGNFVVAWASYGSGGTDSSDYSVHAQRYDATGNPLGAQFQVNGYTTYTQSAPAVAGDSAGNFVIAWTSIGSSGTDTSNRSIQAQRYRSDGTVLGEEFQVNTYATNYQGRPDVASDGFGNFVVAWESDGSAGTDTSYSSVQAQSYDGLFRDGFESGDFSRWSATAP